MNESPLNSPSSRREFIKTTGRLAAASALAGVALPHVHAAGSDLIQVALIGCGGRGTGAAQNAVDVKGGQVKLVAMADVFQNRIWMKTIPACHFICLSIKPSPSPHRREGPRQ